MSLLEKRVAFCSLGEPVDGACNQDYGFRADWWKNPDGVVVKTPSINQRKKYENQLSQSEFTVHTRKIIITWFGMIAHKTGPKPCLGFSYIATEITFWFLNHVSNDKFRFYFLPISMTFKLNVAFITIPVLICFKLLNNERWRADICHHIFFI